MTAAVQQQILISGVGGQGVLFVTRLLAEAAIARGLPVFTSETHGMAQRGGTVVAHFKVGEFYSPLIRAGQADGLLLLKSENLIPHRVFLKPGGWVVVNSTESNSPDLRESVFSVNADELARKAGNVKSVNLVILGFALAVAERMDKSRSRLFCSLADIHSMVVARFSSQGRQQSAFQQALQSGYEAFK